MIDQILTLFTSSLYYAALISTFGASHVTRNKGRRFSILCGAISFFVGAILNAAAQNIAMLIIGRCLLGVGIGFGNQVGLLYNSFCVRLGKNIFCSCISDYTLFILFCRQFRYTYQKWHLLKSEVLLISCFNSQPVSGSISVH